MVADYGFRFKKDELFRSIPGGYQDIGLGFVDRDPEFKISLVVAIRLDAVEEIANKFNSPFVKSVPRTDTFTCTLERFMPRENTHFVVCTEADIKNVVERLRPVIERRIIPFLNKTQDIRSVAAAMELPSIPKHGPGHNSALVVARLIGHPKFESMCETYQHRISKYPGVLRKELDNLIQYLRGLKPVVE